jgi:hypothetical protein
MLTDLESTHQGRSFEVQHNMVPSIPKFYVGILQFLTLLLTMKVKIDQPLKLIS